MVGTARPPAPERRRAPSGRRRRWIPPQHGAWAMLLVPYLAGLLIAGFSWPALPLLVAWIAGYLLSYYALLAVKVRRFGRFRPQILAYGTAVLIAGAMVLAARPEVLLFAPVFGAVLLVNGAFAARRDDRALLNGLVSAAAATAVLPLVAVIAGESPWRTGEAVLVTFLYFAGTVLFVKTCIRERENTPLFAVSAGFHAAALAVVTWLSWVYTGPFAWYLVRAVVLRRHGLPAKRIGVIEVASSILLLAALAIAA